MAAETHFPTEMLLAHLRLAGAVMDARQKYGPDSAEYRDACRLRDESLERLREYQAAMEREQMRLGV